MTYYHAASIPFSGTRFSVTYALSAHQSDARKLAEAICIEQSIEFPFELLPDDHYWNNVTGTLEDFVSVDETHHSATISYALETISPDLVQFLNIVYGNVSMISGVRVERVDLPNEVLTSFRGPQFGIAGLRKMTGITDRALMCATLKPMGLSLEAFKQMAFDYAYGGANFIKDDHGITDQPLTRFHHRVKICAEAVLEANAQTGWQCVYAVNVSGPIDQLLDRAFFAKEAGASALLIMPGLVGWDAIRLLRDAEDLNLPIITHPAYSGVFYTGNPGGIAANVQYGIIPRLAGADASIFPNYVGRLSSTRADCLSIVNAAKRLFGPIPPMFAAPGGGITLENIPELKRTYGPDVLYIMGGGLHRGDSVKNNCRRFTDILEYEDTSVPNMGHHD